MKDNHFEATFSGVNNTLIKYSARPDKLWIIFANKNSNNINIIHNFF